LQILTLPLVSADTRGFLASQANKERRAQGPPIAKPRRRAYRTDGLMENSIIASLRAPEYKRLLPIVERVKLERGEVVYRANRKIEAVYFPEDAVVAVVDRLNDGRMVEVGTIGREGMLGLNIFLAGIVSPDKAIVLLSGGAIKIKSKDLRELSIATPLRRLLLDYARTFLAVISQSVACSQHHTIQQRLARWLLTINDHSGGREILMIHKSIAEMLGARRVGITEAASELQSANLISYRRGRIQVLDRARLGKSSCECYRFIRQEYVRLHALERHSSYRK
jgi:CRP-like cAMP-binding protein